MRQSKTFVKTLKETPKDEVSMNAQLLIRAGFIDKVFAGVYNILPFGLRTMKHIEQIIREELDVIDGQELFLPALHPIENYQKTDRDAIDVLFFTKMRDGKDLVLGQSHEEIITPLVQKHVHSYKDLPQAIYQFQNKFRNELRAKSGIMRGREFRMKDLYSFHTDKDELDKYYTLVEHAYSNIFDRVGLGHLTIKTLAAGGTFSQYSHEYQTITDAGEDTIYACSKCSIAINKEIIDDTKSMCPECGNKKLEEKKAIEIGNIFKLGTKFSGAFDFIYIDKDGASKPIVMGCYGIGITRLLGTIAEIHHDKHGLTWPASVAPFDVHLVSLSKEEGDIQKTDSLYHDLLDNNVDVLYDDRREIRAGHKFSESDLIGIPIRIVVSAKTLKEGSVEVKMRDKEENQLVKIEKAVNIIHDLRPVRKNL